MWRSSGGHLKLKSLPTDEFGAIKSFGVARDGVERPFSGFHFQASFS